MKIEIREIMSRYFTYYTITIIINKAGKNGKVDPEEREYLMFGNNYKRF